jgi:hypothetical protein
LAVKPLPDTPEAAPDAAAAPDDGACAPGEPPACGAAAQAASRNTNCCLLLIQEIRASNPFCKIGYYLTDTIKAARYVPYIKAMRPGLANRCRRIKLVSPKKRDSKRTAGSAYPKVNVG